MTCEHARALIDRFVLDELSPAQARTLADHVRGCVACTAEGNVGKCHTASAAPTPPHSVDAS